MQKWIFISIFILGCHTGLWAQQAAIKGRVIDAVSNEPLAFVNLIVTNTNLIATTDVEEISFWKDLLPDL